jgi:clan AA aspartic protease
MGTFSMSIEVGDPTGQRWQTVEALVDTGSTYTWLPGSLLERLGVERLRRLEFETADGRVVERDAGQTWVRVEGRSVITLVVFADDASPPLLGAYTLEGVLLAVDPVNRRLMPVRGLAM